MGEQIFLETERMTLRRLTEADADHLVDLDSDPAVMEFLTGGVPTPREAIVAQILPSFLGYYSRYDHFGFWAAIDIGTGDFLGWFHLRPSREGPEETELGYRLKKMAWGRGLATEGSKTLIDKGFQELGVTKLVSMAMSLNVRSRRVMEKLGLVLEKEFVYPGEPFPGWRAEDCLEVKYVLTREHWESLSS